MFKLTNLITPFGNYEALFNALVGETARYIDENPALQCMVLGFSGGADSTLTGAIVQQAIKASRDIKLVGVCLPSSTNKEDEVVRAGAAQAVFSDESVEYNIDHMVKFLAGEVGIQEDAPRFADKVRLGNLKARARMIMLYDLARKKDGLVLSTDNYTELLLGFWTLHGDVGDYSPIQELWKTEVYGLLQYLYNTMKDPVYRVVVRSAMEAVPTDGLGITDSDLDQIQAPSYQEVDQILIDYIANGNNEEHPVIQRHIRTGFKRNNPITITRNRIVSVDPTVLQTV